MHPKEVKPGTPATRAQRGHEDTATQRKQPRDLRLEGVRVGSQGVRAVKAALVTPRREARSDPESWPCQAFGPSRPPPPPPRPGPAPHQPHFTLVQSFLQNSCLKFQLSQPRPSMKSETGDRALSLLLPPPKITPSPTRSEIHQTSHPFFKDLSPP